MTERRGRKRHSPEQIIAKLREADAMLASGRAGCAGRSLENNVTLREK